MGVREALMAANTESRESSATEAEPSFSVVAPKVELPKGGGAIRGIGEKFAANPVTGTGSMSVPIAASPGRSDFGPKLALAYDSGSGNGPFGFGWSLNVPQITRKTDRGLPLYNDAAESDVFIVSGSEDLVPVSTDAGRHADSQSVPGYMIHRYRPRIEGAFARIERWTRDDGDMHWRSISPDNVLTIYGQAPDARIVHPANPARVFSWLISETRDDRGNAIVYSYKPDGANRYLKRIRYGNRRPLLDADYRRPLELTDAQRVAADWMFELVFDYGEHDPDNPAPQDAGEWNERPDAFSVRKPGFEVRTARRCERVLMFHHFPELEMPDGCLVKSTDLSYDDSAIYSFVDAITHSGWRRVGNRYRVRSLPPVEFEYSKPEIGDEVKHVDTSNGLPMGIDGAIYRMVDLDGYGAAGVLTEQGAAWYYSRNLTPVADQAAAHFAAPTAVRERPSVSLSSGNVQFVDLAGDGFLDLAVLEPPMPGFYEHDPVTGWAPFRPIDQTLNRDLGASNVKMVDITGDGLTDVLMVEGNEFLWHESLGEEGFGPQNKVWQALDSDDGPRLIFSDSTTAIHLADMTGDGLTDLVEVTSSAVSYWPSLGYGLFDRRVTLSAGPFDHPDRFDPARILLADIDGSGTNDVIYSGADGVDLYVNACGNVLIGPTRLPVFPHVSSGTRVATVDLRGDGTACLVWSSGLPAAAPAPLRYVELMAAGKPHLMTRVTNNLGAETEVRYTTSTALALEDELAGDPWRTRVSFPVHVVEKVVTKDHVSGNRFTSSYRYRDGYFDPDEREFRGFARVDQLDTEQIAAFVSGGLGAASNEASEHNVPPILTRTWFHTGAPPRDPGLTRAFADEYFAHPALDGWLLDDTVLSEPDGPPLSEQEMREAIRSLKGSVLRTEVYALDAPELTVRDPGLPYSITEQNLQIGCLQRRGGQRHAVFFTHSRETLSHQVERDPADPRTTHTVILDVDEYGNVLREASIAYGRRAGAVEPDLLPQDLEKQRRTHVTVTERAFTNPIAASVREYRTPSPAEEITYEVRRATAEHAGSGPFAFNEVRRRTDEASDGAHDIAPEDVEFRAAAAAVAVNDGQRDRDFRRVIEHLQTRYRRDDLDGLLPVGTVEPRAVSGESYKLAFTKGLVDGVFQRGGQALLADAAASLAEAGYSRVDDTWWLPSGRTFFTPDERAPADELEFAAANFFLPHRYRDAFGNDSVVGFDDHRLLVIESTDAIGNRVTINTKDDAGVSEVRCDYRVLHPYWVTDPNNNRVRTTFDTLGMVVATAVMGKPGEGLGDLIDDGFDPDLTQEQLDALHDSPDPVALASDLLGKAGSRVFYDLDRFRRSAAEHPLDPDRWQPAYAATISRETHHGEPGPPHGARFQLGFSYSDGLGREIQQKAQAEPGPLVPGGQAVVPRWVGTGWTVLNNKGKPVRQYEPFFSSTHQFEFAARAGVSPVLFYDTLERAIATLHPNNTYEKVVFTPWRQTKFDVNDTCAPSSAAGETGDPETDPDVAGYVAGYIEALGGSWQTWHARRIDGALGEHEQAAARRAAAHANTPVTEHFDALGRPFVTIERNRVACEGHELDGSEDAFATRVEIDIEGNQRSVRDAVVQAGDPLGRVIVESSYDLLGNSIFQRSMEAGARWTLNDAAGQALRSWDDRGHDFHTSYDALRRPLEQTVRGTDATASDPRTLNRDVVVDRVEYGEGVANAEVLNLRAQVHRHFDSAGVVINAALDDQDMPVEAYDFKGNSLRGTRRLTADSVAIADWSGPMELDAESFESSTVYDALNRAIQSVAPRSTSAPDGFNITQPVYNEAGLLERVDVWLGRSDAPNGLLDPATEPPSPVGVDNIDYDAKGQRQRVDYSNGATTSYVYDPQTFRLVELTTERDSAKYPEDYPKPPNPKWPGKLLQNLHYVYDPAGNITHIRDDAQQAIFFRNKRTEPSNDYVYDALYRLVHATGREHLGQQGGAPIPHSHYDSARIGLVSSGQPVRFGPNDVAMATYIERYVYDAVGNFAKMQHRGSDPAAAGWTRTYAYGEPSLIEDGLDGRPLKQSNRLGSTTLDPSNPLAEERYLHDPHGNMTRMPHLGGAWPEPNMHWDHRDRLRQVDLDGGQVHYMYDASGERVRKVWQKAPGLVEERIYLGGFEVFRRHRGPQGQEALVFERETLHVTDDTGRIAMTETRTVDTDGTDTAPRQLIRYQLGNHLSSAVLELNDESQIISYEEYSPYGSTTYQAVRSATEMPKRYRYTGKERDDETGFYYHGARYYAPWLARWTACDPVGFVDGPNVYVYVRANPVNASDPTGQWSWKKAAVVAAVVTVAVVVTVATAGAAAPAIAAAATAAGGALGATGAAAATVAGTVAAGAAAGALSGAAADLTAQALTRQENEAIDMSRVGAAAAGGAAAGGVLSIIPGVAAARNVASAVRAGGSAAQALAATRTATAATGSLARQTAVAGGRGMVAGGVGGATEEAARQVASGEYAASGEFDLGAIGAAGGTGVVFGAGGAAAGTATRAASRNVRVRLAARRAQGDGPAAAAVHEPASGMVFTGTNAPSNQPMHPLLEASAREFAQLPSATHPNYYGRPGQQHAEINALSDALHARGQALGREMTAADLGDLLLHVQTTRGRRSGMPMPRCSRCSYMTNGVSRTRQQSGGEREQFNAIMSGAWPTDRPF